MFHFEHRHEPLAAQHIFLFRVLRNFVVSSLMILVMAGLGTWGFYFFEDQPFDQGLHNAAKIISGLDPARPAEDELGKWFEIVFHLLSSLVVVVATGIFLLPILHRVLHRFHVGADGKLDSSPND